MKFHAESPYRGFTIYMYSAAGRQFEIVLADGLKLSGPNTRPTLLDKLNALNRFGALDPEDLRYYIDVTRSKS